jgi:methyl coenzyme M reductase subunit D
LPNLVIHGPGFPQMPDCGQSRTCIETRPARKNIQIERRIRCQDKDKEEDKVEAADASRAEAD